VDAFFGRRALRRSQSRPLARIVTLEQGKALGEAVGEISRAAVEARFMAGAASRAIGQTFPGERPGSSCYTTSEPLGVIAAICPWNFPIVTPVRKIAPALAWGNTVVFKPSSLRRVFDWSYSQRVLHTCQSGLCQVVNQQGC